jgi:CarboxypepD_reg-like domain
MKFKDYIRGDRKGKLANQLERKALDDPFMQDALDGFHAFNGNHLSVIEDLERKVLSKSTSKNMIYRRWLMGVAASFILIVGVGLLFYHFPTDETFHQTSISKALIKPADNHSVRIKKKTKSDETAKNELIVAGNLQKQSTPSPTSNSEKSIIIQPQAEGTKIVQSKSEAIQQPSATSEMNSSSSVVTTDAAAVNSKVATAPVKSIPIVRTESRRVVGKILEASSGKELVGASISIEGTKKATTSDLDGNFSIDVTYLKKPTLIVSIPGYEEQRLKIESKSKIEVVMEPKVQEELAHLNDESILNSNFSYSSPKSTEKSINSNSANTSSEPSKSSSVAVNATTQKRKSYVFGEEEFKKYFERNRKESICEDKEEETDIRFNIDKTGMPSDIYIYNCTCTELETELKKVLESCPRWSVRRLTVTIHIQVNSKK